jgi:hypothetical protein
MTASSYMSSAVDHNFLIGDRRMQQIGGPPLGGANNFLQEQVKAAALMQAINQPQPKEQPMSNARIVKIFIADPNENLPLEKRVLFSGDEQLTDLTDQELFYEVPIADLLAKHNDVRKATVDKKQAEKFGRDIFLEPARIRDLKMVVVTVAQF